MTGVIKREGENVSGDVGRRRQWPFYSDEARETVAKLIDTGDVFASTEHELIDRLEAEFAEIHRPGGFALFMGSGTHGLLAAYFALGLEEGAEVLVPTHTFRATATPLLLLNLRPVLCDIEQDTGILDLEDAERRITSKTRAICVMHVSGHPANMAEFRRFADRHGLALLEDASHAHGARFEDRPVGSDADLSVFSLGTTKLVSGGMAGMVLSSSKHYIERAALLGHTAAQCDRIVTDPTLRDYVNSGLGANLRGSPIAAALALDHLHRLPQTIAVRNRNLALLDEYIATYLPNATPPVRKDGFTHGTWYGYRPDWQHDHVTTAQLIAKLQKHGVPVSECPDMLHKNKLFADISPLTSSPLTKQVMDEGGGFPVADAHRQRRLDWDTRLLFEPADELLDAWKSALQRVAEELDSDLC